MKKSTNSKKLTMRVYSSDKKKFFKLCKNQAIVEIGDSEADIFKKFVGFSENILEEQSQGE